IHPPQLAFPPRSPHRRLWSDSKSLYRMSSAITRRWPAEWEPHAATWIGWPHHEPDWPGKFEPIPWVYAEIVRVLHRSEPVRILCNSEDALAAVRGALLAHDVDLARCELHVVPSDRVWLRDSGATGVYGQN